MIFFVLSFRIVPITVPFSQMPEGPIALSNRPFRFGKKLNLSVLCVLSEAPLAGQAGGKVVSFFLDQPDLLLIKGGLIIGYERKKSVVLFMRFQADPKKVLIEPSEISAIPDVYAV